MTVAWYEKHLEELVKQNERLKHHLKKQGDWAQLAIEIRLFFTQLFPDIPSLDISIFEPQSLIKMIVYYKKTVALWIELQRAKIQFLEEQIQGDKVDTGFSKNILKIHQTNSLSRHFVRSQDRLEKTLDSSRIRYTMERPIRNNNLKQLKHQTLEIKEINKIKVLARKLERSLSERDSFQRETTRVFKVNKKYNSKVNRLENEIVSWKDRYEMILEENKPGFEGIHENINKCQKQDENSLVQAYTSGVPTTMAINWKNV